MKTTRFIVYSHVFNQGILEHDEWFSSEELSPALFKAEKLRTESAIREYKIKIVTEIITDI